MAKTTIQLVWPLILQATQKIIFLKKYNHPIKNTCQYIFSLPLIVK